VPPIARRLRFDVDMDTSTSLLKRLAQCDDREAWPRFVELYTPLIFTWARRAGLSTQDAADLVQDVLTLLVQKLPGFRYDAHKSFRAWLRTVTLNKWREKCRRPSLPTAAVSDSGLANLAEADPAEAFWETEYRQQLVQRALRMLEPEFQPATWKACWEYVVSGRPADEVAAESGLSVWTVYAAKSRLLRRLREELDGMLD
jgi:RNA polymerase sigma-70 factor (ECF subfamily)